MGEKRAVVYTVDDNLDCKLQMLTSIESVRAFMGGIDIVVLTTEDRPDYEGYLGVKTINVSRYIDEYNLTNTGIGWRGAPVAPMLLFRLVIPVVEELSAYDKVLYLDSDTEVWSSKISDLFTVDTEGHEITAVRDSLCNTRVIARVRAVKDRASITNCPYYQRWNEVLSHCGYVNSGVIVFNLRKFRHTGCTNDRIKFIINQLAIRKPPYPDQDILNAYFDIYLVLDRRYNDWRQRPVNDSYLRHNVGDSRRRSPVYPPRHAGRPDDKLGGKFEKAYIITESHELLLAKTLGRLVPVEMIKVFKSPFASLLYGNGYPVEVKTADHLPGWFGHYQACKLALSSGLRKVLITEDTWGFDKNLLSSIPVDCDIAVLDGAVDDGGMSRGSWVACDAGHRAAARSSKAYVLSRRAMVSLVWLFESLLDENTPDRRLRYVHKWLVPKVMRGKLRMYYWSK